MKQTTNSPTLKQISKLLDQKLDISFAEFEKRVNDSFERLESKVDANFMVTHEMIKQLRKELNQRFDAVNHRFDQNESDHQEILDIVSNFVDGIYKSTDKRLTKLERKVFAS